MPTLALRPETAPVSRTAIDIPQPRDPVFKLGDDIRAREHGLIAPDVEGLAIMSWLEEPGTTGKPRAQEILDLCATEKHNGVIWTVHHYLKVHPTGNVGVDQLGQWDLFRVLGISTSVENVKTFLRHIVMNAPKVSGENPSEI